MTTETLPSKSFHDRCRQIQMLTLDVDGVLTNGGIFYSDHGQEIKAFHVRDGSGLKLWAQHGKMTGIISGRRSEAVQRRAKELDIAFVQEGVEDKLRSFRQMLNKYALSSEQVCFIGDDFVDIPVLRSCGLPIAVADACVEAKEAAVYVTRAAGGHGAVREVIELILRAQGAWHLLMARYLDVKAQS